MGVNIKLILNSLQLIGTNDPKKVIAKNYAKFCEFEVLQILTFFYVHNTAVKIFL